MLYDNIDLIEFDELEAEVFERSAMNRLAEWLDDAITQCDIQSIDDYNDLLEF